MIPLFLFEHSIAWIVSQPDLMDKLNAYKASPDTWSRKNTRDLCNKLAWRTEPFWETKGYNRSEMWGIYPYIGDVVYAYIHSQNADVPLTHRKTVREIHKKYDR
ncbi:MAG: hypothetical protein GY948_04055 [Alphaproteobacteria bacterium]|nr:hypothetical protein [Alphaproteobacteria bacterium]